MPSGNYNVTPEYCEELENGVDLVQVKIDEKPVPYIAADPAAIDPTLTSGFV